MTLMPDTSLWINGDLYIARPLTVRNWTFRQALRDAEWVVRGVQRNRMKEAA